ncbi:MAG: peroxide stress protein YaaA [Halioglobus sp.]|nr:peroxide stress protein YaaA [Halioglobus sp.]
MLTVISPAKTLDFETPSSTRRATQPQFLPRAAELVEDARELAPDDIRALMGVSETIAELNHQRFMNWSRPFTKGNAKQSLLAFKGDVYVGLDAATLNEAQLGFAQQHLRILSGLYGLLRPLDLMQPYRLEMGLPFANRGGKNLYEFWSGEITDALNTAIRKSGTRVLVNLASQEYFRAVQPRQLDADVITPVFKDLKGDRYKVISFYAKKARGQMARYIIEHEVQEPDALKKFRTGGYRYNKSESSAREFVFTRDTPPEKA